MNVIDCGSRVSYIVTFSLEKRREEKERRGIPKRVGREEKNREVFEVQRNT